MSNGVRAGKAFVQLLLDNKKLLAGLKGSEKKFMGSMKRLGRIHGGLLSRFSKKKFDVFPNMKKQARHAEMLMMASTKRIANIRAQANKQITDIPMAVGKGFKGFHTSKLTSGLDAVLGKAKMVGSALRGIGTKMLAVGGAATLMFMAPIRSASRLEETMNKFDIVFGKSSKEVKKWGDDYAASVGRSRVAMADFLSSSQDLLVPMGMDDNAAQSMSKQITKLAVDLASFNNKADEDVIRDLHAALTGSGEVMKKYGVIVSEAAVKQELLNMGMNPKKVTEAQKAQARMNIIMRGTTAAQGDAIRSSGSYANQMKRLNAVFEDTKAAVGKELLPVITPMVKKVGDIILKTQKWLKANGDIIRVVAKTAVAITAAGGAVFAVGAILGGITTIASGAVSVLTALVSVAGAISAPFALVTAALVGGTVAFFKFTDAGNQVLNFLGGMLSDWKSTFGAIAEAAKGGDMKLAFDILIAQLKVDWYKATSFLAELLESSLTAAWKGITSMMPQMWKDTLMQLSGMFTALMRTIEAGRTNAVNGLAAAMVRMRYYFNGDELTPEDMKFELSQIGNQSDWLTNLTKVNANGTSNLEENLKKFLNGPEEDNPDEPKRKSGELLSAEQALETLLMKIQKDSPPDPQSSDPQIDNASDAVQNAASNAAKVTSKTQETRNHAAVIGSQAAIDARKRGQEKSEFKMLVDETKKAREDNKKQLRETKRLREIMEQFPQFAAGT